MIWEFLGCFGMPFGVLVEVLSGRCCQRCWRAIVGTCFALWGLCWCNFFPQIAESYRGSKVICEIEGRVLRGIQFGVLVEVLFCESDGRALGGMQFRVLVEVLFCESDGRALGGMQFRVLVEVLFCESDGRVLGGMQFGLVVQLLFWVAV